MTELAVRLAQMAAIARALRLELLVASNEIDDNNADTPDHPDRMSWDGMRHEMDTILGAIRRVQGELAKIEQRKAPPTPEGGGQ